MKLSCPRKVSLSHENGVSWFFSLFIWSRVRCLHCLQTSAALPAFWIFVLSFSITSDWAQGSPAAWRRDRSQLLQRDSGWLLWNGCIGPPLPVPLLPAASHQGRSPLERPRSPQDNLFAVAAHCRGLGCLYAPHDCWWGGRLSCSLSLSLTVTHSLTHAHTHKYTPQLLMRPTCVVHAVLKLK